MTTKRLLLLMPREGVGAVEAAAFVKLMVGRLILLLVNYKVSCSPIVTEPDDCFIFKNALAVS